MTLVIVATVGAADANSYITLAEAKAYCEANLYAAEWDAMTDVQKNAAIVMATRLLDADKWLWSGTATSSSQALCWPRVGMISRNGYSVPDNMIPRELKDATAEFARQLVVSDRQQDNDPVRQGIASVRAGTVSISFHGASGGTGVMSIPKEDASWIIMPDLVRAMLPPSWKQLTYQEQILKNKATMFFQNLPYNEST